VEIQIDPLPFFLTPVPSGKSGGTITVMVASCGVRWVDRIMRLILERLDDQLITVVLGCAETFVSEQQGHMIPS
jgi:hypothetical protein